MLTAALCLHSHYSMLEGTTPIPELCRLAKQAGYTTIALTDVNNLYGLWPYLRSCAEHGLSSIIGTEVREKKSRLFCLVKNQEGYGNLCQLLSALHCSERFDLHRELATFHKGLLILPTTVELLHTAHEIGCDVVAALCSKPNQHNHQLRATAAAMGIKAVAVCDAFFGSAKDYPVHKLLCTIQHNKTLSTMDRELYAAPEAYLPNRAELTRRFAQWPETLTTIQFVREKCSFAGPDKQRVMPPYQCHQDPDGELRTAAFKGARRRYGTPLPHQVRERLNHELKIIAEMDFSSYFLVVQDIVGAAPRTCGCGLSGGVLPVYHQCMPGEAYALF